MNIKTKVISIAVCIAIAISSVPLLMVSANQSNEVSVKYNGKVVNEVTFDENESIELEAYSSISDVKYQWQIMGTPTNFSWINIQEQTDDKIEINFAMIKELFDLGAVYVRVAAANDDVSTFSNAVELKPNVKETKEEQPNKLLSATPSLNVADTNGASFNYYTVTVEFLSETDEVLASPYVATIHEGGNISVTVPIPEKVGYKAYYDGKEATEVNINLSNISQSYNYVVRYKAIDVQYTVKIHKQDIYDDNYEDYKSIIKTGLMGTETPNEEIIAELEPEMVGFYPTVSDKIVIAADGSTVLDLYYDREYYLMFFNMGDGGHGTDSVFARYDTPVNVKTPERSGYLFRCWTVEGVEVETPTKVPSHNTEYVAKWNTSITSYTKVYWRENANDSNFAYWGSTEVKNVMSSSKVSGSNDVASQKFDVSEAKYFTYLYSDQNVVVNGDGSSVVNIYYSRNRYTILYERASNGTCQLEEHKHNDSCYKIVQEGHTHTSACLICGKSEEKHNTSCCCIEAHNHSTALCKSDNCTHKHSIECYVSNPTVATNTHTGYRDYISTVSSPKEGFEYRYTNGTQSWSTKYYYIYFGGKWYYLGTSSLGASDWTSVATRVHVANSAASASKCTHTHTDSCYSCGKVNHTHNGTNCDYSQCTIHHQHTESCYGCGKKEQQEAKLLICGKYEHTHNSTCSSTSNKNYGWVVHAKYMQSFDASTKYLEWPTATTPGYSQLDYWEIDSLSGGTVSQTSKVYSMTKDFSKTTGDNTLNAKYHTEGTWEIHLYYAFESFDQTSPEDGYNRFKVDGVYYDSQSQYSQTMIHYTNAEWNAKEIKGVTNVGKQFTDRTKSPIYYKFYYKRNIYSFDIHDYAGEVKRTYSIPYGAELTKQGIDLSEPEYPKTLEVGAYEFVGWYTTPECYPGTEFTLKDGLTMDAENIGLFPKYQLRKHTVKLYKTADNFSDDNLIDEQTIIVDGKTVVFKPIIEVYHGDTISGKVSMDIKNGDLTLKGWFYNDGTTKKGFDPLMPIHSDMQIYADWQSDTFVDYIIHYMLWDEETQDFTTKIADDTVGMAKIGSSKVFMAKGKIQWYEGYNDQNLYPEVPSHNISMNKDSQKNEYTFKYKTLVNAPYMVRYLDAVTKAELHEPTYVDNNQEAVVNVKFLPISDYVPDSVFKTLRVSWDESLNVVTFYYTENGTQAPYVVETYYQNVSGDGYTKVGEDTAMYVGIGTSILPPHEDIKGFTFNTSISSNKPQVVTVEGAVFRFYYDRNKYPVNVSYKDNDTGDDIITPKTENFYYQSNHTISAIDIPGYTLIGVHDRNISIGTENAPIVFNYVQSHSLYNYVRVGIDFTTGEKVVIPTTDTTFAGGIISVSADNVLSQTGTATGSIPTAGPGYRFAGWYRDEDCTQKISSSVDYELSLGDDNKLTPLKSQRGIYEAPEEGITYYALFMPNDTSIKIENKAEDGSFIYIVHGTSLDGKEINLEVAVPAGHTVKINDIPVGNYTVTQKQNWSWNHKIDKPEVTKTVTPDESGNVFTFNNIGDIHGNIFGDSNIKSNIFND